MRTKLAYLISKQEGYGVPGAIPTVRNNPGDLRHSPHSSHEPGKSDDVGHIDTIEHGWSDLERQLQIYAQQGLTLRQMVNIYLGAPKDADPDRPNEDGNNVRSYLSFICIGLGMPSDTPVAAALKVLM